MNQYATTVRSYYAEHRPDQAATMSEADFAQIGETIAAQIVDLSRQLEGPDDPTETHLAKVGRLNRARASATETVLQQWLPTPTHEAPENPPNRPSSTVAPATPPTASTSPTASPAPSSTQASDEDSDPEMDAIWWALDRVRDELQRDDEPS